MVVATYITPLWLPLWNTLNKKVLKDQLNRKVQPDEKAVTYCNKKIHTRNHTLQYSSTDIIYTILFVYEISMIHTPYPNYHPKVIENITSVSYNIYWRVLLEGDPVNSNI